MSLRLDYLQSTYKHILRYDTNNIDIILNDTKLADHITRATGLTCQIKETTQENSFCIYDEASINLKLISIPFEKNIINEILYCIENALDDCLLFNFLVKHKINYEQDDNIIVITFHLSSNQIEILKQKIIGLAVQITLEDKQVISAIEIKEALDKLSCTNSQLEKILIILSEPEEFKVKLRFPRVVLKYHQERLLEIFSLFEDPLKGVTN